MKESERNSCSIALIDQTFEAESADDKNNNNMYHLIIDIIRLYVPSVDKPAEKTINIISSRFNHYQVPFQQHN